MSVSVFTKIGKYNLYKFLVTFAMGIIVSTVLFPLAAFYDSNKCAHMRRIFSVRFEGRMI